MCGCSSHQAGQTNASGVATSGALSFEVGDMTCGHCAGTIKKAIETTLPGTQVHADPQTKTVSVTGTADLAALRKIVTEAGYTPALA